MCQLAAGWTRTTAGCSSPRLCDGKSCKEHAPLIPSSDWRSCKACSPVTCAGVANWASKRLLTTGSQFWVEGVATLIEWYCCNQT